jgi:hypothetical protein
VRGIVFTQQGVPVKNSSDYQKVLDSRWVFMEVEAERDINTVLPAMAAIDSTQRYYEKTILLRHNLGFLPAFEGITFFNYSDPIFNAVEIYSDENTIFLRRLISSTAYPQQTVTGSFRLYNLPILTEYQAPSEIVSGASAPKTDFGVKFIDGSVPNITPGDTNVQGFSVDTTKKILSVHKHGLKYFNQSALAYHANVTAIDTASNILTVSPYLRTGSVFFDLTWVQTPGRAFIYFPSDLATYPAPLSSGGIYYNIPVDATHIKLADSYQAALNGNALDLTTAGSLPASLAGQPVAGEDTITHGIGYPPTYMLAPVNEDEPTNGLGAATYIGPLLLGSPPAIIHADSSTLRFKGVQSLFAGKYGYIILKDPAEIAQ